MGFLWGRDKKANQQAAVPGQDDALGASYDHAAGQNSNFDGRNHHDHSQQEQIQHYDPQITSRNEGGKKDKEHRFRKSKNRSQDNYVSPPAEVHQPGSTPAYNRPPPPQQQHSNTFPTANSLAQRGPIPERGASALHTHQEPASQFSRGLWSWIPHVTQSAADATVIENVKGMFVYAEQFVSNFYAHRPYSGEVPNEILDRVNFSTSMSTLELQECLTAANLHNPIITHVLINLLLNLIAFDLIESEESLLPKEFQNYMILAKAKTKSTAPENEEFEFQPALSSYRVLSAFLRSDIKSDQNYLQERQQVIEKVINRFERAFQHWTTNRRSREDRTTMLRKLLESAGDLGIFLFSQPAVYDFNWSKDSPGMSDGCVAIWPRLLRVCDNDAQWKEIADHMVPIQLGVVIDRSIKPPEKTKSIDRDPLAVDTGPRFDPDISQAMKKFSSLGKGKEDDPEDANMTASQHIARGTVVVEEEDNEVAHASDDDTKSGTTWPSSGSDLTEDNGKNQNPFETEIDTPPEPPQPPIAEAKTSKVVRVPTALRPGSSRDTQVHHVVTSNTERQSSKVYTQKVQDSPLGSYESIEKPRRPDKPTARSMDQNRQSPQSTAFPPLESRPWLEDDQHYNRSSPNGSPSRVAMTGLPRGPRSMESPRNLSPARVEPRDQATSSRAKRKDVPKDSSRPSSAVFTKPLPKAYTMDSYDTEPVFAPSRTNPAIHDIYSPNPPPRFDRPDVSLDQQVSSRYYSQPFRHPESDRSETSVGRPRAFSNSPPKTETRARPPPKSSAANNYPPNAYNRQFSSSNPDRMTDAEDRQWEGHQITPMSDDADRYGDGRRGRSSTDRESGGRRRSRSRRSSSVGSMVKYLANIGSNMR